MLSGHVQALLGLSYRAACSRLRTLRSAGLLACDERPYGRNCHQITARGLDLIGSRLRRPGFDVSTYWHDVGVAWLWLAARDGSFGALAAIVSERGMRSSDGAADPGDVMAEPFGVRLGGWGPAGHARLHYPDVLLETTRGHRVALELELSGKTRTHREKILAAYSFDRRIDAVVYFVDNPGVARAVSASVARLRLSSFVHVQPFKWDAAVRPRGRGAAFRHAGRVRAAERGRDTGRAVRSGHRPGLGRAAETGL